MSFGLKSGKIQVVTWNALFWIIMLFTGVNAVSKTFTQESEDLKMYYYNLIPPQVIIFSKIVYNTALMLIVTSLGFVFYVLVMGNPVQDTLMFFLCMFLGALGFASVLTMISAIASQVSNSGTMMVVLGFPTIIPFLIMLLRMSKNALDGLGASVSQDEIIVLSAMNVIVLTLSYVLFPYVWRS